MPAIRRDSFDIVVAGSGIAGLSLALALRQDARARIVVCDPALAASAGQPPSLRAVAIAAGSRRFLDHLGVWASLDRHAQPMTRMVLTDTRPDAVPPPVFLDFEEEAAADGPFAHMMLQDPLRSTLLEACAAAGVETRPRAGIGFTADRDAINVTLDDGGTLQTRLLVAADGGRSLLRDKAGIRTTGWDYGQSAIVATVAHDYDHGGQATQHFLPHGPLAILPLRANDGSRRRFSIVWTESRARVEHLLALPPEAFLEELRRVVGHTYGELRLEDRPRAHPLRVSLSRDLIAPRFALVGDAARTIHPLAGQGLNLGLRDAEALAEEVTETMQLGLDPGAPAVLEAYQRRRRADATAMAVATDLINRLFSNDSPPVRLLRDLGLGLVDRAPGLKRRLISRAAGTPDPAAQNRTATWI